MCYASVNDLFALVGQSNAGGLLSKSGGGEELIHRTENFLSRPRAKGHLERNGEEFVSRMLRFSQDDHFIPEIAEKLIQLIEKVCPETAACMAIHLPKKPR